MALSLQMKEVKNEEGDYPCQVARLPKGIALENKVIAII